ncbi:HIT family protein [Candidatus Dojkabacteria bacterium]|uniref:HIT family protein n=1 Tax=Candidatus Dojkabacteria bacterium TaxID=2099670 RepID=A0A955IF47_9BACT|nr:HIT family protein [Candidatus Dojkabacteria bacterium]
MSVFTKIIQSPNDFNHQILKIEKEYLIMLSRDPLTLGHSLVIPKLEYRDLSEIENLGAFFEKTYEWAIFITEKLNAPAYTLKINNKLYLLEDNGHVDHIHFHIIPRYSDTDDMLNNQPERLSKEKLKDINKMILG